MKTIVLLCLATACFAQSSGGGTACPEGAVGPPGVVPEAAARYLIEYTTSEPCPECGFRYAIGCWPPAADCGVPVKHVSHFETFDSKAEAIEFLNAGMERKSVTAISWLTNVARADETIPRGLAAQSFPKTFVRLMEVREVPVDVKSTKVDIPQPPVSQETKRYALKP